MGALQLWNGPVAFHHCYCDQKEAPAKANEISKHPFLECQALRFCLDGYTGWFVMELAKLTDKMDKTHNHVEIFHPGGKWRESLFVSVSTFNKFHSSSQFDANRLSATRSQQNALMHSGLTAVTLKFESFFHTIKLRNGEIWRWKVDFGQNDIFCVTV